VHHSDQPGKELEAARSAIEAMRKSVSFEEFEKNWKEYLRRLERIWSKSSAHFGKSPKWNGWQAKFLKLRKTDLLLSYLINARGAEEHTVNEIVRHQSGHIGINAAEGDITHIDYMKVSNTGIYVQSRQPLRIDFIPARTHLVPVTNRGREYGVPSSHLGSPVDPTDIIAVAELGIAFYESFLSQAESFFVK
jgi:uncharacterized membrane protein